MADKNQKFYPIRFDRGEWKAGDLADMDDGYCRSLKNHVLRANRADSRPPFVYDSLMTIRGLAMFDDQTNKAQRGLAINSTPNLFMKGTSGETWGASIGSVGGTRFTDGANYRGKFYGMMDNGSGLPSAAFSFDGTTIDTTPFNSAIQGRTVTQYLDRIFIAYPRVTTTAYPVNTSSSRYGYVDFGAINATIRAVVVGSTTTTRVWFHTAGVTATFARSIANSSDPAFPTSTTDQPFVLHMNLRSADGVNVTPLALFVIVGGPELQVLTPYAVGDLVVQGSLIHRCTTAGTSATPQTILSATLGGTAVDGTVTWTCISSNTIGYKEIELPRATGDADADWHSYTVRSTLPARTNAIYWQCTIQSGTAPSYTVANTTTFDIGYRDGLADGAVGKRNFGMQATLGDFAYPFVNKESADTTTTDLNTIIWSEVLQPTQIRASATYELQQVPGYPTAATVLGARYLVFKRGAVWVFNGNQDITTLDVIPIRREREYLNVGCLGPKALDSQNDVLFFISEDDVCRFTIGMDEPEGIGGDAMREEIMARGSDWVESQATYNMPILRINKRDKELLVYTQKSKIYVYNIERKGWTTWDVPNGAEVADMIYNPNTRKMYVAIGGYGLARVDWNAADANDTIDNTANTYTGTKEVITRPIEAFSPRVDWIVDNAGVFHLATASQSGQLFRLYASFDRGATFTYDSGNLTLDITDPRNEVGIFESAPSVTLKITHTGKLGKGTWAISKIDADMTLPEGAEWPQVKPT